MWARGQLCEILGKSLLAIDKDFRTMQFGRVADRELAAMDADSRSPPGGPTARGVNHFHRAASRPFTARVFPAGIQTSALAGLPIP